MMRVIGIYIYMQKYIFCETFYIHKKKKIYPFYERSIFLLLKRALSILAFKNILLS